MRFKLRLFWIPFLAVVFLAAGLVLLPRETATAARRALSLCGGVLLPSLFPFFVLSGIVLGTGLGARLGRLAAPLMRPLFRVNGTGAAALVLGSLGGYPIGASCAVLLYESDACSQTEAERLLAFCNNSGPSFVLGAVGAGIFGSMRIGVFLYLVHIVSALLVGLLFRFYRYRDRPIPEQSVPVKPPLSLPSALYHSIQDGLRQTLNVCAFVIFFAVLSAIFTGFSIFPAGNPLCLGFLEVTSGVSVLPVSDPVHAFPLAALLIGFAGVSVHCQTLSLFSDTDLRPAPYLLGKGLHGLLSYLLALPLARWLFATQTAFAPLFSVRPHSLVWGIFGGCLVLVALVLAKRAGKPYNRENQ